MLTLFQFLCDVTNYEEQNTGLMDIWEVSYCRKQNWFLQQDFLGHTYLDN